jgi:uncharacterized membrane protein
MSIKTLRKTRWKINPGSITVSPYGLFYILAVCLAVAFGAMITVDKTPQQVIYILAAIVVVVALFGNTSIVFNQESQLMQRKLFGFLPTASISFEQMEGINIIRNNTGGYNFQAFKKNNKFGKGIVVSCGYSKDTDANALAFVQEVINPVHAWLDQSQVPEKTVTPITSYRFFRVNHTDYLVKRSKILPFLGAVGFTAFGIYALLNPTIYDESPYLRYGVIIVTLLLGFGGVIALFTKMTFDTSAKVLRVASPIRNKEYAFTDFDGFQIVRRSTNMIYTGTDVKIYFRANNNQKEGALVLKTFLGTKKIDRFLDEVKNIMQ